MAWTGQKIAFFDLDDTIGIFRWLRDNPAAPSIYGAPSLAWMKQLHDDYGAVWFLPAFYSDNLSGQLVTLNTVPANATWRAEFSAAASWLRFGFHSHSPTKVYPPNDARSDFAGAGGLTFERSQFHDFQLVRDQIRRICGPASWAGDSIYTGHFISGRLPEMRRIVNDAGGTPPLWITYPTSTMSAGSAAYHNDYFIDSDVNPELRSAMTSGPGYYEDPDTGWLFRASSAFPDDNPAQTFASYLNANVPTHMRDVMLLVSHEHLVYTNPRANSTTVGQIRQFFTDAAAWCNANGYAWGFPTQASVRAGYGLAEFSAPAVETTPPFTTIAISRPALWNVSFSVNELGAVTYYRANGGEWSVYTGSPVMYGTLPTTIDFYSVDSAGNAESMQRYANSTTTAVPPVAIDPATTYQTIDGFGAGIASHEAIDDATADFLFKPQGLGLTIARQYMDPFGHFNDGSANSEIDAPYPPGVDLPNSIKARDRGVRHMAFAQWAPRAWRTEAGDTNKILPAHYAEWAQRYATFLDHATENGITIESFSVANEPDAAPWGLLFTAAELHTFVHDHLVPAIAASSQPSCKVMIAETSAAANLAGYVSAFSSAGHLSDVGVVAHHGYGQTPTNPNVGLPFWQTEASANSSGLYWARRIHDYVSAGASAYLYLFFWTPSWYSASPSAGLLGAYSSGKPLTTRALAFAHFARWVRPGDVRVQTGAAPENVYVSAYKRANGAFAAVLVNDGSSPTPVDLTGIPVSSLARYQTIETVTPIALGAVGSLEKLSSLSVSGGAASILLPAQSMTTLFAALSVDAPIVSGTGATVTGMRLAGSTVTVSAPGATVGAVSYPDATTWACTVSDLTPGVTTTITVTSGGDTASVDAQGVPPWVLSAAAGTGSIGPAEWMTSEGIPLRDSASGKWCPIRYRPNGKPIFLRRS